MKEMLCLDFVTSGFIISQTSPRRAPPAGQYWTIFVSFDFSSSKGTNLMRGTAGSRNKNRERF